MTKLGEKRKNKTLIWVGLGLWAAAILLYLTVKDPAAMLTIRIVGIAGFALLIAGLIRWRRERPAGN